MKARPIFTALVSVMLVLGTTVLPTSAASPTYNINTLAGKVASINGTGALQVRFSALLEQEAEETFAPPTSTTPINPPFVLSSPLDGTTVQAPGVTVNQDSAAAPQNETAIAVDPNNPNRIVAGSNDYSSRAWTCTVNGAPCSLQGDAYSGTDFSNDGGHTWCCTNSDPQHLGTLIPGVEHLTGGIYDAGGDPSVAFDSRGNVYYAGLGFDRTAAPNTVTVNKGTFDNSGHLTWSAPTFINPTTSPAVLNDKEWIGVDANASSSFRDRIYVSWTRYVFNANNGNYVQSPIYFVYSTDGGKTFTTPKNIAGNVLYDQGSRPIVASDGTLYVIFNGSTRLAALSSTYIVKSTDGGVTFGKPVKIADVQFAIPITNAVYRDDSFPAGAAAPNGDLYVAWTSLMSDGGGLCPTETNTGCHESAVYSKSTDGGATWTAPAPIFPALDASTQTPAGYPAPDGLTAPAPRRVDTQWPGVAVSPSGTVYMSAYAADVVSPWQTCASGPVPPVGRIECDQLDGYIHNARLDYYVTNIGSGNVEKVTGNPINTRNGFGGGFIGDYTSIAAGSDNVFHAFWTDTNNKQTVTWFYGLQFTPTVINQEDVVTASGHY